MASRKKGAASTSNGRKFRTLERTEIEKWEKGKVVEGTLKEIRTAGKGYVFDIATEAGYEVVGCPTILRNYLKQVDSGAYVRITCDGKISTPNGDAWDFTVEVAE